MASSPRVPLPRLPLPKFHDDDWRAVRPELVPPFVGPRSAARLRRLFETLVVGRLLGMSDREAAGSDPVRQDVRQAREFWRRTGAFARLADRDLFDGAIDWQALAEPEVTHGSAARHFGTGAVRRRLLAAFGPAVEAERDGHRERVHAAGGLGLSEMTRRCGEYDDLSPAAARVALGANRRSGSVTGADVPAHEFVESLNLLATPEFDDVLQLAARSA